MAASSTGKRIVVLVLLLGTLALFGLVVLGGAFAAFQARRAAAIWPRGIPALEVPEPVLPADPAARAHLGRLIELTPDSFDDPDPRKALEQEERPPRAEGFPEDIEPAIEAMDRLVECSGLQLEPLRPDQQSMRFLDLLSAAKLRLVRAWAYAEQGRSDEALAEMIRTARMGVMLEQAGGHLLAPMTGKAVGGLAMEEIRRLVVYEHPPSAEALALLTAELEAAHALPSGLGVAILSECSGSEQLLDEMRWWTWEQLTAASSMSGPGEPPQPVEPGGAECCFLLFDADKTIQLLRQRCQAAAVQAGLPGKERHYPEFERLLPDDALALGPKLDNAIGRTLLDLTTPSYAHLIDHHDEVRARRALLLAWVALQRWRMDHPDAEALPATLDELVPAYLTAVPADPWDGEPVGYSASERLVWSRMEGREQRLELDAPAP